MMSLWRRLLVLVQSALSSHVKLKSYVQRLRFTFVSPKMSSTSQRKLCRKTYEVCPKGTVQSLTYKIFVVSTMNFIIQKKNATLYDNNYDSNIHSVFLLVLP